MLPFAAGAHEPDGDRPGLRPSLQEGAASNVLSSGGEFPEFFRTGIP